MKALIWLCESAAQQNREALKLSKEHSKLVKLAAKMSAEDYEHAGIHKLEDEIAGTKAVRQSSEEMVTWVRAEIGMHLLPAHSSELLCLCICYVLSCV